MQCSTSGDIKSSVILSRSGVSHERDMLEGRKRVVVHDGEFCSGAVSRCKVANEVEDISIVHWVVKDSKAYRVAYEFGSLHTNLRATW